VTSLTTGARQTGSLSAKTSRSRARSIAPWLLARLPPASCALLRGGLFTKQKGVRCNPR